MARKEPEKNVLEKIKNWNEYVGNIVETAFPISDEFEDGYIRGVCRVMITLGVITPEERDILIWKEDEDK